MTVATDLDGTYGWAMLQDPPPTVCISGRTWAEYDNVARTVAATMPLYIRGEGVYGDQEHAGQFKAAMCDALNVTRFYEDDPVQADIIRRLNMDVEVVVR